MERFSERNVVVTGGSSGIGRAVAQAFVAEGAWVLATGRSESGLQETRNGSARPEMMETVLADLMEPSEARRVVREAVEATGRLHVLANCAGIAREDTFLEMTEDTWRSTMGTNLDAAIWASQEAARHMAKAGGGVIVSITSVDAFSVESPQVHYNTSKAALQMATRSMAHELAPLGIRVNAVAPGQTVTPMVEPDIADPGFSAAYLHKIPLGRYADPAEQAKAVLFLASDDAAYITGETIVVDGGETLGSWYDPRQTP
jgi:NAD(P)-dependent dehydrogenase (short-subunit alcohol dehydrogenase family)